MDPVIQSQPLPDEVVRQFAQLGQMVKDLQSHLNRGYNPFELSRVVGNRLYIFNTQNYTVVDTEGNVGYAQNPGDEPSTNFNTAYLPGLVNFLLEIMQEIDHAYLLPSVAI